MTCHGVDIDTLRFIYTVALLSAVAAAAVAAILAYAIKMWKKAVQEPSAPRSVILMTPDRIK